ncbi:MAG: D-alanyl-D-alanine carboxypeptidase [Alphaproteobacteria bacterium]|nr:D-alanyl-D-alanine carboxypeptidase [Alphaproteobacteria bacterium]
MKAIKTLIFVLSLICLTTSANAETLETLAKQAIIIDYDTGAVLLSKNADERMPTSSMSKVMTVYLVDEALDKGKIALDTRFTVSEKAWRMQGSKMFVELGGQISVEDLMRGVMIQSGNDATIVLAEGLAGTEEAFAQAMNAKAKELGMKNTHFANASGWPDPEHYSTARDLAILGRATIKNFPERYKIYAEKDFTYNDIKQGNRNPLLYQNVGADGIKTGHTEDAGYGLIGSGVENGRRVILVINGLASQKERAEESAKLLTWGLRRFENKNLLKAGAVIEQANVAMGQKSAVPLVAGQDVTVTLPKLVGHNIEMSVQYKSPLIAPLQKGQEIGSISIKVPDLAPMEAPLLVGEDIPELGFFAKTLAKAKILILGT